MKKQLLICLLILVACFFCACHGEEQTSLTPSETQNALWMEPYPTEGEAIATIQGETYYYDPVYLFRFTGETGWEELTKENAYRAIAAELTVLEATEIYSGFAIQEESINQNIENEKESLEALKTATDKESMERYKSMRRYIDLAMEQNSYQNDNEYWEDQRNYIPKAQFLSMGAGTISEGFQNQSEYQNYDEYYRNAHKELREKYNVVFTYPFDD